MKSMNNMLMFASGVAMGVMYMKYEKQICRCARSMMRKANI